MAKIDVLLPFWGDVSLLKEAVSSVINQTEKDWKLFVIDDCYPSKAPAEFIESLNDNRIIYIRHQKNIGVTQNFNYALTVGDAPHCVMMGCDDLMLPSYLERALTTIGNADFYQPMVEVIDANGDSYLPLGDRIKRVLQPRKSGLYSGQRLAASLCNGNWLYFPSIVWKSKVIKRYGFETSFSVAQDVVLELSIIKDSGSLSFDKTTTFRYRRFSESISSVEKRKGGVRFKEETMIYQRFSKDFDALGWRFASLAAKVRITSRLHRLFAKLS